MKRRYRQSLERRARIKTTRRRQIKKSKRSRRKTLLKKKLRRLRRRRQAAKLRRRSELNGCEQVFYYRRYIRGGFHAKALLFKEEQENKTNEEADAEKKAKPKKKSKISEDITVELLINDVLDPTTDQLASSKKRSNSQKRRFFLLHLDFSVWRSITYCVSAGCRT